MRDVTLNIFPDITLMRSRDWCGAGLLFRCLSWSLLIIWLSGILASDWSNICVAWKSGCGRKNVGSPSLHREVDF